MVQVAIRIGLLALLLYWSFILIRPFIPILVWGIVLAVALYPVYAWLSRNLGDRPRLAAVMITLLNLSIVIGPVAWLGIGLIGDLKTISDHLGAGKFSFHLRHRASRTGRLSAKRFMISGARHPPTSKLPSGSLPRISNRWPGWCSGRRQRQRRHAEICRGSGIAGYLFLAGPRLVTASRNILARIVPQQGENFVGLAGATIRTISQGVIGIAIVQSLFIGIGFKLLACRVPAC